MDEGREPGDCLWLVLAVLQRGEAPEATGRGTLAVWVVGMVVLALVLQDEAGTNLFLGHRSMTWQGVAW